MGQTILDEFKAAYDEWEQNASRAAFSPPDPKDYGFEGWADMLAQAQDVMNEMGTAMGDRSRMSDKYKYGRVPDIEVDVRQKLAKVLGYGFDGDSVIVMLGAATRIERLMFENAVLKSMLNGGGGSGNGNPSDPV